jgi:alpha-amylase
MGVMLQAFHWDCPAVDDQRHTWWNHVKSKVPSLAQAGITALWLPPVHKAGNVFGMSMGYDPYDYYDLGEFDQKGARPTWFGTRDELAALIDTAHAHRLQVIADVVINHNNGADSQEVNPIDGRTRWTKFEPASGTFKRDANCFHPTRYETRDFETFGDMPDLAHRNPYVFAGIMELSRWLVEDIGFDGFRYDFVKGYGSWLITAIQEYRYTRHGTHIRPFGVGENWDSPRTIDNWVNEVNAWNDNPVTAFDFPNRDMLKALCDWFGFDMRSLASWDTFVRKQPTRAVTFVENHDLRDGDKPIFNDKLLAYAHLLTHEGYPCVFWKDYFNYGLALHGTPNGIDALIEVHETLAGGASTVLWADQDLYVMQRSGNGQQPGLILVLNNRRDGWNGTWVSTRWAGIRLRPAAWWSAADLHQPDAQWVHGDGRAQVWAPPRGFSVYTPEV